MPRSQTIKNSTVTRLKWKKQPSRTKFSSQFRYDERNKNYKEINSLAVQQYWRKPEDLAALCFGFLASILADTSGVELLHTTSVKFKKYTGCLDRRLLKLLSRS